MRRGADRLASLVYKEASLAGHLINFLFLYWLKLLLQRLNNMANLI